MAETLEAVLADAASEVDVAKRYGHVPLDDYRALVARLVAAAQPFTTWLSESDAALYSGHTVAWLRARRAAWARMGHARRRGRTWEYRRCTLPRRVDLDGVRADAGRTARGEQPDADTPCVEDAA